MDYRKIAREVALVKPPFRIKPLAEIIRSHVEPVLAERDAEIVRLKEKINADGN